jgi:DNA repair exonuclease SbcCD ATPase subunit
MHDIMRINSSYAIYIPIIILCFSACKDYKPEMEQALMQRDSVLMVNEAKDSSLNEFIETLNVIELNLDSITQAQNAISMDTKNTVEFSQDIRDRISANIMIIGMLLQENQEKIDVLNDKLRKSNINLSALRKQLIRLKSDIELKDVEIAELNNQLVDLKLIVDSLNMSVSGLNTQNATKEKLITDQRKQINTAYYIIGSYKDLKEKGVISAEGGFLGIGKEKILKHDFNTDTFIKIDITKVKEFVLNYKDVKIITNHPSNSYMMEKNGDLIESLKVKDPTSFWGTSKYLVIVTG